MHTRFFTALASVACAAAVSFTSCDTKTADGKPGSKDSTGKEVKTETTSQALDTAKYNSMMKYMAEGDTTGRWPVKGPYPKDGAIFPFNRVVAYYGNLFSKKMGVLGEYQKDTMLAMLKRECAAWEAADSMLPVIPALHYVAVTAQGAPGAGGKYRLRMPFHQIDTIVNWSKEINGLAFVDIQVGHASLQEEVPALEPYLKMPTVHLGIDPEFSMKGGDRPGSKIGTFDASDINYTIDYLADVVRKNNIPPKILVVHRFTQGMVTNYQNIKNVPEVQVVIDMDGWGPKILKRSTWDRYLAKEPVNFTGFKIFYKNDTKSGQDQLFMPTDLAHYWPKPLYIQYQ